MISVHFKGKPFNIIVFQVYALTSKAEEFYKNFQNLYQKQINKKFLFIIRDWNAKVGSQEIPGVTGNFGLGVQNVAGQRLTKFCQENAPSSNNTRADSTHGHHQMVDTEIRLTMLFAAKDGEAL